MAPVPKATKADNTGPVPNLLEGAEMDERSSINELWFD